MDIVTLDKYFASLPNNELTEICRPLFTNFSIDYFSYLKVYPDGSRVYLSTHPEFVKWIFRKGYFIPGILDDFKQGVCFLKQLSGFVSKKDALKLESQIIGAREYFNIDFMENGIELIFKNKHNYCEIFEFSASPQANSLLDFYINNIDVLQHFVFYFKDRAKKLIKLAEKNKINLHYGKPISKKISVNKYLQNNKQAFYQEAKIKNIVISDKYGDVNLSGREIECLVYLIMGCTAKETAGIINISSKTVEAYLESAKQKLNCNRKSELIKKVLQTGIVNYNYLSTFV